MEYKRNIIVVDWIVKVINSWGEQKSPVTSVSLLLAIGCLPQSVNWSGTIDRGPAIVANDETC
jgi:hypothetical protein